MNNNNLSIYEKRDFINLQNAKLLEAIEKENIERIKKAIRNGADVDRGNGLPFQHAVKLGKLKSIEFLITQCTTPIRNHDNLALKTALENNDYETAKLLLKHGALIGVKDNSFLKFALTTKNITLISFILDNGANIDPDESVYTELALETSNEKIFELIVNKGNIDIEKNKDNLLLHSVKINDINFINMFIDKNANITIKDNLLLSLALQNRNKEVAELLMSKGALFSIKNEHLIRTIANALFDRKSSINLIKNISTNREVKEELQIDLEKTNMIIEFIFSLLKIEDIPDIEKTGWLSEGLKKEILSDLLAKKFDKILEVKEVLTNKKIKL